MVFVPPRSRHVQSALRVFLEKSWSPRINYFRGRCLQIKIPFPSHQAFTGYKQAPRMYFTVFSLIMWLFYFHSTLKYLLFCIAYLLLVRFTSVIFHGQITTFVEWAIVGQSFFRLSSCDHNMSKVNVPFITHILWHACEYIKKYE